MEVQLLNKKEKCGRTKEKDKHSWKAGTGLLIKR